MGKTVGILKVSCGTRNWWCILFVKPWSNEKRKSSQVSFNLQKLDTVASDQLNVVLNQSNTLSESSKAKLVKAKWGEKIVKLGNTQVNRGSKKVKRPTSHKPNSMQMNLDKGLS